MGKNLSEDRHDYNALQIILIARRAWLVILVPTIIVGLVCGWWSYTQKLQTAGYSQTRAVVSMPAADSRVEDLDAFFSESKARASRNISPSEQDLAKTILVVTSLGDFDRGRGALLQLLVKSPSPDFASAVLKQLLGDLDAEVRARHPGQTTTSVGDELNKRIADLNALLEGVRSEATSTTADSNSRAAALSSVLAALSTVELVRNDLAHQAQFQVRVELPPTAPSASPDDGGWRWIRIPILACLASAILALLAVLMVDAARRATSGQNTQRAHGLNQ